MNKVKIKHKRNNLKCHKWRKAVISNLCRILPIYACRLRDKRNGY